jgi:hypothetical protein
MHTLCLHSDGRLLNHQQQSLVEKFIFAPKHSKRSFKRNEFSIAVGPLLAVSRNRYYTRLTPVAKSTKFAAGRFVAL